MASSSKRIEVVVRVRPRPTEEVVWSVESETSLRRVFSNNDDEDDDSSSDSRPQKTKKKTQFWFDRVFDEATTNEALYAAFGAALVEDAMKGYHSVVVAYGQTASGKTHSLQGTPSSPGFIPLAIEDCFRYIERTAGPREYAMRVSYVEVYNEALFDLLQEQDDDSQRPRLVECGGSTCLVGCVEESVASVGDVFDAIVRGEARRRVGETPANPRSSRSHAVLRLTVESADDSETTSSTLSFCDLAGSERADATPSTTTLSMTSSKQQRVLRQKEGAFINKSLHALAHVVSKLSSEDPRDRAHVPYRDSKLTRLLRPALGGNARVGVVCTCSPCDVDETANTLQFASRAKRVAQVAVRNNAPDAASQLKAYKQQVFELKRKLAELERRSAHRTALCKTRPDEREALASAVEDLERLILRSGGSSSEAASSRPLPTNGTKKVDLEPRFFASLAARSNKKNRRSLTLPPPPPQQHAPDLERDASLDRVAEDEDGATARPPSTAPSEDTTDTAVEATLTPQLRRIKQVLQDVLTGRDDEVHHGGDADELRALLRKAQDDTKFVLDQLDKAEAENRRLTEKVQYLSGVVEARDAEILQLKGRDDEADDEEASS